ncbi:hypothetical protein CPB85DRAFT_478537 [Mucidula mucida]|nr:hypothetical protein CPB85DRAFT_478537 [Mucidula mucida]
MKLFPLGGRQPEASYRQQDIIKSAPASSLLFMARYHVNSLPLSGSNRVLFPFRRPRSVFDPTRSTFLGACSSRAHHSSLSTGRSDSLLVTHLCSSASPAGSWSLSSQSFRLSGVLTSGECISPGRRDCLHSLRNSSKTSQAYPPPHQCLPLLFFPMRFRLLVPW